MIKCPRCGSLMPTDATVCAKCNWQAPAAAPRVKIKRHRSVFWWTFWFAFFLSAVAACVRWQAVQAMMYLDPVRETAFAFLTSLLIYTGALWLLIVLWRLAYLGFLKLTRRH